MNHKQAIHAWIKEFNDPGLVFDMTCGNGHDTLFLASIAKHVVAVDVQVEAIENTKLITKDYSNITFIHESHDNIDLSDYPVIDGAIYNLGYLPGSNKHIITESSTTLRSLQLITPHLTHFLVVSCYRKHCGGNEEYLAVKSYLESLNAEIHSFTYDTELSPVTFMLKFK